MTLAIPVVDVRNMPHDMARLYALLSARMGKSSAIGMAELYEQWSGERLPRDARGHIAADLPALSRKMRYLIDDLRDIHGVPIMSSTKHGYWIVANEEELRDVVREFRARGLKSLTTAARLKQISLADELQQIEIDLRKGAP